MQTVTDQVEQHRVARGAATMGTHCYACPRKSGFKWSASRHFSFSAAWLKSDCRVRNWGYLGGVSPASDAVLCCEWLPKRGLLYPADEGCRIVRMIGKCSPNDALSHPWRLAVSVVIRFMLRASTREPLTAEARVWSQVSPCGIFTKAVITIYALPPTLAHTPDSQYHCFERFLMF